MSYPGRAEPYRTDARNPLVRILIEISIPAHTVAGIQRQLSPGVLPPAVMGHLEQTGAGGSCGGPASGGGPRWVPCWLTLQGEDPGDPALLSAVDRLRGALVDAAREGGVEIFSVPAAVQVDDTYLRLRDLGEVLHLVSGVG